MLCDEARLDGLIERWEEGNGFADVEPPGTPRGGAPRTKLGFAQGAVNW